MIRPLTLGDPFLLPIQNVALVISGFARNGCQTSNVRASCVVGQSAILCPVLSRTEGRPTSWLSYTQTMPLKAAQQRCEVFLLLGIRAISIDGGSADGCTTVNPPDCTQTAAAGHFIDDDGIVEFIPFCVSLPKSLYSTMRSADETYRQH